MAPNKLLQRVAWRLRPPSGGPPAQPYSSGMLRQETKSFPTGACAAYAVCVNGTTSALVLLLTRDCELQREAAIAATLAGARLILPQSDGEALQIIFECRREIDLVATDLDDAAGMTSLSALTLPPLDTALVALTSTGRDRSAVFRYANDAACCLAKPINAVEFEMVIHLAARPICDSKTHSQELRKDSQFTRRAPEPRRGEFIKRTCKQSRSQLHQR